MRRREQVRVGIDVGGTFTDIAIDRDGRIASGKVLTDHTSPERAIIAGISQVAGEAGIALSAIEMVIHGTTLVTNALIERRGARTALITTRGFRDVIEMRTENRFEQYDLDLVLPTPLIARADRFTLNERIDARGNILQALDEDELAALVEEVGQGGYESIAVGLIHSYVNDSHERRVRDAIRARHAGISISISSQVSPQMREYERFNTVCANAYVKPMVAAYLHRLEIGMAEAGIKAPIFMMHSGGGLMSVESASEFPVRLLESGPAGGAIYAADFARSHSLKRVLSYDMGGTTAKICLIEAFEPKTANSFEVARTYRFKKGSGMPISIPSIDMVEIGAGGGSIGHVDALGQIRVGPESAGSEPGPSCFQRGGKRPTVTDANLLLGRIDPDHFAGGSIPLSRKLAEAATGRDLAKPLGLDAEAAAFGICETVDENMANAARVHAIESGKDISHFTMIAFGGAAPLHACRLCEKLGIDAAIVPPGAGVGSAIGFLKAPFAFQAVRGAFMRLSRFDPDRLNTLAADMRKEAEQFVRQGAPNAQLVTRFRAFMRYAGQGWEIPVEVEPHRFKAEDAKMLREGFEDAYRRYFSRVIDGLDIEIVNWSVSVSSPPRPGKAVDRARMNVAAATIGSRDIFDGGCRARLSYKIVARSDMRPGDHVSGPGVIIEDQTSTIITSTFDAIMQADGSILLLRKQAGGEGAAA